MTVQVSPSASLRPANIVSRDAKRYRRGGQTEVGHILGLMLEKRRRGPCYLPTCTRAFEQRRAARLLHSLLAVRRFRPIAEVLLPYQRGRPDAGPYRGRAVDGLLVPAYWTAVCYKR